MSLGWFFVLCFSVAIITTFLFAKKRIKEKKDNKEDWLNVLGIAFIPLTVLGVFITLFFFLFSYEEKTLVRTYDDINPSIGYRYENNQKNYVFMSESDIELVIPKHQVSQGDGNENKLSEYDVITKNKILPIYLKSKEFVLDGVQLNQNSN